MVILYNVHRLKIYSYYIMSNLKIKPQQHQLLPISFMKNNFGLLLWHSVGSGKTITSLLSVYQFIYPIVIIGPKSSKKTFDDEISKLGLEKSRFTFYTFSGIKKLVYTDLDIFAGKSLIIDEAHHLRNETKDVQFLTSLLRTAKKIILLTATPVINYPNDISILINIIKKEDALPLERELFEYFYYDRINNSITDQETLRERIKKSISYFKKNDTMKEYPKTNTIIKSIIMNGDQIQEYGKHVRRFIYDYQVSVSANLYDIKFDYLNRSKLNSFLSATRMISNTVNGEIDTPKIVEIVKIIKDGPFPVTVYSNFLDNGLYPVAKALNDIGIPSKMITGNTTVDKLASIVNSYNDGNFKVLLLSSAGSESITLKKTRQLHIMEPHFNDSKINQVIGRVVRYKSHTDLPKNEQVVNIYHWSSVFPPGYNNLSADEYLIDLSIVKTKILKSFEEIAVSASIEKL